MTNTPTGSHVTPLTTAAKTLVNQLPIEATSPVRDGDMIAAGGTVFHVSRPEEPTAEEEPSDAADDLVQPAVLTPLALCQRLEFDEDVQQLAAETDDHETLIELLVAEQKFIEALRVRAHGWANRVTVWWGVQCVQQTKPQLPDAQQQALAAAVDWVAEPGESLRRRAESCGEAVDYGGLGGCLALGAFGSEGSFAPVGIPYLEADDRVTGQAVAAALLLAAYQPGSRGAEERLAGFLATGQQIASGKVVPPWET